MGYILSGEHLMRGDVACVEGAIAAGCRFLAAYPIVPAIGIAQRFLERAKEIGAIYIQMEDEISALAAVLGASWTGKKSMTATAGPGFSLMAEHIGLGVMLETPCVIVDVQHIGPGIGMPNYPSQGDMRQAKWCSHGCYEIIAIAPSSPQEMFDFTIKAFNLSEKYRCPVILMADEYIAKLEDKVIIPDASKIKIEPRRYYKGEKDKYLPFKREADFVPPMVDIGEGYRFHVTGLTHDERGYPVMSEECQELNVHPLMWKIRNNKNKIVELQEIDTEDAEILIVAYGTPARVALKVMEVARKEGIKLGVLKLITVWPFPDEKIRELAKKVKCFIVPEMNYGQIVFEVERAAGDTNVIFVPHGEKGINNIDDLFYAVKIQLEK